MMGSHAAQISQEDRWKLTYYIQKLQGHDLEKLHGNAPGESDNAENVDESEDLATL